MATYRIQPTVQIGGFLTKSSDPIWIGSYRYTRYFFPCVPGRKLDVIIADSVRGHVDDDSLVIEVNDMHPYVMAHGSSNLEEEARLKPGVLKSQYETRRRYAIRHLMEHDISHIQWADLHIMRDSSELMITVRPRTGAAPLVDKWTLIDDQFDPIGCAAIVNYQRWKWFTHLDPTEVAEFATSWETEVIAMGYAASWTLLEAFQAAGRALYRFSLNRGWRRMTAEESARLQFPAEAWQRLEVVDAAYARIGNQAGI